MKVGQIADIFLIGILFFVIFQHFRPNVKRLFQNIVTLKNIILISTDNILSISK